MDLIRESQFFIIKGHIPNEAKNGRRNKIVEVTLSIFLVPFVHCREESNYVYQIFSKQYTIDYNIDYTIDYIKVSNKFKDVNKSVSHKLIAIYMKIAINL